MKNEITDEELIELIEGAQNPALTEQIQSDTELKRRFDELKGLMDLMETAEDVEVPTHIESNLQSAILEEELKTKNGQQRPWVQVAAAIAFLIVGFGLGKFGQQDQSDELASLRTEIQTLREVTLTSTLQNHSASERILAVNRIEEQSQINTELVSTLISTLNSDESPNVRFAALQALGKFIDNEEVRAQLVKSLPLQSEVLIQISLISMLVEAEERSAIVPLRELIDKTETTPEVKQQAEVALKVLT